MVLSRIKLILPINIIILIPFHTKQMSNNPEHTRCAQEVLDGLGDYTLDMSRLVQEISKNPYGSSYGSEAYGHYGTKPVATVYQPKDGSRPVLDRNPMTEGIDIFESERKDRAGLARAKIVASGTVGDVEMTVAEMEHRRKLNPIMTKFLKAYLEVMQRAEAERDRRLGQAKQEGEHLAKEAMASLGTSKAAGEAATFMKSIQGGHIRDNNYELVLQHQHARERAEKLLESIDEQTSLLDSAKTNANSAILEPFPEPPSIPDRKEGEAVKTVQSILCDASPGPASIYSKIEKMTVGLRASTDESRPASYTIAGVKGPGLPSVELYSKDIFQRVFDLFELLVRYQTAMDRFNLDVTFMGGDGQNWLMQNELVRKSQCYRYNHFIAALENSHREAVKDFKTKTDDMLADISLRTERLDFRHKKEDTNAKMVQTRLDNDRALAAIKNPLTETEQTTLAAHVELERVQEQARIRRQLAEKEELVKELDEYRRLNTPEMVMCPEFDLDALKKLRTDYDANCKVNQRRRAPANAQRWIPVSAI